MSIRTAAPLLALALSAGSAQGQSHDHVAAAAPVDSQPAAHAPLFDDLGSLHHAVSTRSSLAQRYFDQGLRLVYAFNHGEAIASFNEAARIDSSCAMCYWGVALALGPNINAPMDTAQERQAYAALEQARARLPYASPRERRYVEALATRYAATPGEARTAHDSAYARAMRDLARGDSTDVDATVLYAEAMLDLRPWDQWTRDGQPKPGTEEVVATLERALARDRDHPGACHYYIHAVEASPRPERALPCAERLPGLMPGAGHLVHMPAHLYMRVGRYADAVRANERAAHVDHDYIERRKPDWLYPVFYYPHNLHFLWAAASMEGRSAEAIQASRDLLASVPLDLVRQVPMAEFLTPTPYFALERFSRWDDILRESAPPTDLRYTVGMWHYARGLAQTAKGKAADAAVERDSLAAITGATPADRMVGLNSTRNLLTIALGVLDGRMAAARGDVDGAVRKLTQAAALEDSLTYDEPPPWYHPVRQVLGDVLLSGGRPAEAERAYREDLQRNRENGWSLHGLAMSLRAQHKPDADVERRWRKAWARADVQL
jgi:tetratricopeptide (TPR) repeat protein